MPRHDLTDITFVLDRSGSMESIKQSTIDAFNTFLRSQKEGAGDARLTLVQFDDQYEPLYQGVPIRSAPELTTEVYHPRGTTALLDAIGRTIVATGVRLRQMSEPERPGAVVFVTLTDGYENASKEYSMAKINEMIREQRDTYSWQFIFLGANQDAIATAAQIGVGVTQAMTFAATPAGTANCLDAVSAKLHKLRSARARGGLGAIFGFDSDDRDAAMRD